MAEKFDLRYDPATLLGALDRGEVQKFQEYLQECDQPIIFDPAYLDHLSRHHGGIPKKRCFRSAAGHEFYIERFLNFVDEKTNKELGWYNVEVTWTQIEDRLNEYLIPFALLFSGNFLCFNHESDGRPTVVVWLHEESSEDEPVTEFVANNFDEFLAKLYEPSV